MNHEASPAPWPAPVSVEHDDLGRVVAVVWSRPGGRAGPGRGRWLVAVDGSPCSLRAVGFAAGLVETAPEPAIDVVYVHPWLTKEAAESELPRRAWEVTADARAALDRTGVDWRVHARMGDAATAIAALADALDSRGIVIGSRGLSAIESLFLGSVAYKVVHGCRRAVLIVR